MRIVKATVFLIVVAAAAEAQRSDSVRIPLPGPGQLVGFVADANERPVEGAEVVIAALNRSATTGPDGSFKFADIKSGKHQLTTRRLGYYPQGRLVEVGENGGATAFWLSPRGPVTLPTVVSSAARGGLSGVVGDTAFNIIEGARLWVLGSDRRGESDSTGTFFLDLKPGRHILRVERPGYGSKLVSVTIPRDSGRRIMVWLSPATAARAREAQMFFDLSQRLTRRSPVWSKVYTREDFVTSGMKSADRFASAGAGKRIPDYCEAIIDGTVREPLWVIDPADIELMEVYSSRPARRQSSVRPVGGSGLRGVPQPPECMTRIYVWLRK